MFHLLELDDILDQGLIEESENVEFSESVMSSLMSSFGKTLLRRPRFCRRVWKLQGFSFRFGFRGIIESCDSDLSSFVAFCREISSGSLMFEEKSLLGFRSRYVDLLEVWEKESFRGVECRWDRFACEAGFAGFGVLGFWEDGGTGTVCRNLDGELEEYGFVGIED